MAVERKDSRGLGIWREWKPEKFVAECETDGIRRSENLEVLFIV